MHIVTESNKAIVLAHQQGYRVNDDGTVTSFTGKKRKLCRRPTGYDYFYLRVNGKTGCVAVHRLMAFQKYGDALFESGIEVRHLDGNPSNNSPDNIAIGTKSQNMMDRPIHVRKRLSLIAIHKRWPQERWIAIDRDIKNGATYLDVHRKYGVDRSVLSRRYRNAGLPQVRYGKKPSK